MERDVCHTIQVDGKRVLIPGCMAVAANLHLPDKEAMKLCTCRQHLSDASVERAFEAGEAALAMCPKLTANQQRQWRHLVAQVVTGTWIDNP